MKSAYALALSFMTLVAFAPGAAGQPVALTVPPVAVTRTDQAVSFASKTFDAPTIDGELEPEALIEVSASGGTLTLAGTAGLTFTLGDGEKDGAMSFTASTVGQVNAALNGVMFEPAEGFAGGAIVTLSVGGEAPVEASWRVAVNAPLAVDEARAQLMAGVSGVHSGVQPGHMAAYGPEAYDVVYYPAGVLEGPMVTMASWGAGRVVAMGDHQMLNMHSYGDVSGVFYQNAIAWTAGSDDPGITIVTNSDKVAGWLGSQGYLDVVVVGEAGLAVALQSADLFVPPFLGKSEPAANLEAIGDFVRAGGGLLMCDYAVGYDWWWGKPKYDAPGNRLLREAGIGFVGGHLWDTGTLAADAAASGQVNAEHLLSMLADSKGWSAAQLERGGVLFGRIFDGLDPSDPLVKRLDQGFEGAIDAIVPSPKSPVKTAWEKGLLLREQAILEATPLNQLEKHRTADVVFGPVPDDAPRVAKTVLIDPSVTRWHGTGLYAAPGELVTVAVPEAAVGQGFKIRISGHTDNLKNKSKWLRMPKVSRVFAIDAAELQVASPYGGALYVDVGGTPSELPPFDVSLDGAVEAPRFVLGESTDAAWVGGIRDLPAPFAELESERLSMSLPSALIRKLGDPTAVMAFWNEVVEHQDTLGTHGDLRTNAERFNVDVQISAGLLHAGYPIQGPTSTAGPLVDSAALLDHGSWGWFHELGHEAQRRPDKSWGWDNPYTFDGAVEATVNIFTTYAFDALGIANRGGWSWTATRVAAMRRALDAVKGAGTFASVGVGHKLAMYLQLRDGFGWETWQTVLAGYNDDPAEALPKNQAEERDQLLIRFSQAAKHDLGPFMVGVWGLDASPEAAAAVADLPDWLPAMGGIEGVHRTAPWLPLTFDLAGEALSHDGVAPVSDVSAPSQGALAAGEDGWTYSAASGVTGTDGFTYTVTSSTGHAVVSEVSIVLSHHGVLLERWYDLPGTAVSDLTGHAGYPDAPDDASVIDGLQAPAGVADNYGVRMRAFVVVPADGDYVFYLASDDNGELWLSTTVDAAKASLVASVSGWSGQGQYDKYATQASAPVALAQGQAVYLEALMKEGGGGDHLSVAWAPPGGALAPIDPTYLRVFRASNGPPVALDDTVTVAPGASVSVDVLANDSDPDGDPLTLLGADEGGLLNVVPAAGFEGALPVEYTVVDGYGGQAVATLTVLVVHAEAPAPFALWSPSDGATVEALRPRLCWTVPDPAVQSVASYSVTLTDSDGAATSFEVPEGGGPGPRCARPPSPLAAGPYTWSVTALAANGHVRVAGDGLGWGLTLAPDVTLPEGTIDAPADATSLGCTAFALEGTATDEGSGAQAIVLEVAGVPIDATLGGSDADVSRPWSATYTPTASGSVLVTAQVVDAEGNLQTPAASISLVLDCDGPSGVAATAPAAGAFTTGCPSLEWTEGTDPAGVSGYAVLLTPPGPADSIVVDAGTGTTLTLAGDACLAEGGWTWSVQATDGWGNVSGTPAIPLQVDTSGPVGLTLVGHLPAGPWICNSSSVTLSWTAGSDEAGSGLAAAPYEVWLDGEALSPPVAETSLVVEGLADGQHTWSVRVYDALGSWSEADGGTFGVDCTPPDLADVVGLRLRAANVADAPLATGLVAQAGEDVAVRARGQLCFASGACGSKYAPDAFCSPPEGVVLIEPEDVLPQWPDLAVGRLVAATSGFEDAPTDVGDAASFIAPYDGELVLMANVTGGGAVDCAAPWYEVSVHVGGGLGPVFPADGAVLPGDVPVAFEWSAASDDASGVALLQLVVDDAVVEADLPADATTGSLPDGLAAGAHTWTIRATDGAGNVAEPEPWSFVVDAAPPEAITVISPVEGSAHPAAPAICWAPVSDAHSQVVDVLLFVDEVYTAAWSPDTECAELTGELEVGEHCVQLVARDELHQESAPASVCFTVDPDAPSAPTGLIPADAACVSTPEPHLAWTACSDAEGAGIAVVSVHVDGQEVATLAADATSAVVGPLSEGEHAWFVRCEDAAGGQTDSIPSTLWVDVTAPEIGNITIDSDRAGLAIAVQVGDAAPCGIAKVTVAIDGGTPATIDAPDEGGAWRLALPAVGPGAHQAEVSAVDEAGNESPVEIATFDGPAEPVSDDAGGRAPDAGEVEEEIRASSGGGCRAASGAPSTPWPVLLPFLLALLLWYKQRNAWSSGSMVRDLGPSRGLQRCDRIR